MEKMVRIQIAALSNLIPIIRDFFEVACLHSNDIIKNINIIRDSLGHVASQRV